MKGLDLRGASLRQRGLCVEHIELRACSSVVARDRQPKCLFGLFLDFFLRLQNLAGFIKARVGGADLKLHAPHGVVEIDAGFFVQRLGLNDLASGEAAVVNVPVQLHTCHRPGQVTEKIIPKSAVPRAVAAKNSNNGAVGGLGGSNLFLAQGGFLAQRTELRPPFHRLSNGGRQIDVVRLRFQFVRQYNGDVFGNSRGNVVAK